MFEWINELSAWLQSWLSTGAGLWGLFISAFASATVLPGSIITLPKPEQLTCVAPSIRRATS